MTFQVSAKVTWVIRLRYQFIGFDFFTPNIFQNENISKQFHVQAMMAIPCSFNEFVKR